MNIYRFLVPLFFCLFVLMEVSPTLFSQEKEGGTFPNSLYAPFYTCPTISVSAKLLLSSTCKKARDEFWANLPTLFEKYSRNPSLLFNEGPQVIYESQHVYQDEKIIKLLKKHYKDIESFPLTFMSSYYFKHFKNDAARLKKVETVFLMMSGWTMGTISEKLDYLLTLDNISHIRLRNVRCSNAFIDPFFDPKYAHFLNKIQFIDFKPWYLPEGPLDESKFPIEVLGKLFNCPELQQNAQLVLYIPEVIQGEICEYYKNEILKFKNKPLFIKV